MENEKKEAAETLQQLLEAYMEEARKSYYMDFEPKIPSALNVAIEVLTRKQQEIPHL